MPWLKWYDPNAHPSALLVCDWRGHCETLQPTPSAGCYVASTSLEGYVTGVLVDGTRESPESTPIYVPEPSGMFLAGVVLLVILMRGRRRRVALPALPTDR